MSRQKGFVNFITIIINIVYIKYLFFYSRNFLKMMVLNKLPINNHNLDNNKRYQKNHLKKLVSKVIIHELVVKLANLYKVTEVPKIFN